MYAAREQRVIADGLEYTKRTEFIQTNEGFVALETTTLEAQQQQQPVPPMLPVTASPPQVIQSPPEPERCCDYGCCECDENFEWYSFYGKGAGIIILLILLYLIGFAVVVAVIAVIAAIYLALCIISCLADDDN